jgi:hypothetical protein
MNFFANPMPPTLSHTRARELPLAPLNQSPPHPLASSCRCRPPSPVASPATAYSWAASPASPWPMPGWPPTPSAAARLGLASPGPCPTSLGCRRTPFLAAPPVGPRQCPALSTGRPAQPSSSGPRQCRCWPALTTTPRPLLPVKHHFRLVEYKCKITMCTT